jgi:hypothetical protein
VLQQHKSTGSSSRHSESGGKAHCSQSGRERARRGAGAAGRWRGAAGRGAAARVVPGSAVARAPRRVVGRPPARTMSSMQGLSRFLLSACTDVAFAPALVIVLRHRRHFELFVGVFQLVCAFAFNLSEALGWSRLFVDRIEWHRLSDVLSETYALCLLVHCMGLSDERVNIALRYVAFSLALLFKLRDGWDGFPVWQAVLLGSYIAGAAACVVLRGPPGRGARQLDRGALTLGVGSLAAALLALPLLSWTGDAFGVLHAVAHLSGASACYHLWKAVPVMDSKKTDLLPTSSSDGFH